MGWIMGFVSLVLVGALVFRTCRTYKDHGFMQTWVDGLLVNLLASLFIVVFAYTFRKELFNYFQRPKVSLVSSCKRIDNPRKDLYGCKFFLTNETETALVAHKIVIDSSRDYSNFNFVTCQPASVSENSNVVVETKATGESTCTFKIDLEPFAQASIDLQINGDKDEPNPDILQ